MDNEIMTTGTTEIATDAPMDLFDGATGFEGVDKDCVQIPYLKVAQPGTDECKKQSPKYIQGLEAGMFFCPSTRKIYGEFLNVAVLHFSRNYTVYEGTGPDSKFKGSISPQEYDRNIAPTAIREKSYTLHDGLRYVDSRNFIVVPYESLNDGPMILSLSSTGITPSKKLITQATNVRITRNNKVEVAPLWSSVWQLTAAFFDSPNGSYFQISTVERLGWVKGGPVADQIKMWFDDAKDAQISASENDDTATAAAPRDVTPSAMASAAAGKSAPKSEPKPQDIF